ncbi:hypothetical protein GGR32_001840 [Mesonia hippocampi]|uniref:HMA domain-containing protein n=1 Tax=Mesonia hippocampi TaxID=1628250 RepID=A0A840EN40_9FLAO|nr:hypothetical protein [Mesonia hippocampi]MBB4119538.1 hypothetical protein [Mesonia hippocampi]
MNIKVFGATITDSNKADYLLSMLRINIADALIYIDIQENKTLYKIEVNRDITEVVHGLFSTQGLFVKEYK